MYLVAKNLSDVCQEAIQCTASFGPNAECNSTQRCNCKPGHHFVSRPPKCIQSKGKELVFTIRDRRRSCL